MSIVTLAPSSIFDCRLYTRLLEKSTAQDGLAERINAFVAAANPLLDLILAGPFREYTLHNPSHARKLVHLCEYVIDPVTLDKLTALELAVIIMACHLHDLGMCLTSKERSLILSDPNFEEELRNWPQLWDDLITTRALYEKANGAHRFELETRLFQLQEAGLAAFLRPRHATHERYLELISQLKETTGRSDLFTINGVSFQEELIAICMSHNLDVGVLIESLDAYTDRFPRTLTIGCMHLNTQFCAGILRIVDIMDFDRERTPRILFESLGLEDRDIPGNTVSLREWNKHMAVHSIEIEEQIIVSADSSHPAIERSIRDFCSVIEREIRDTIAVLRKNPEKVLARYKISLPATVRPRIRSLGYVYKDLSFRLDESAISTLLMGEGLYTNKAVAIRELVQNAIDACRVRRLVDHSAEFSPEVAVSEEVDGDGRVWLIVEDNGIGMDESILSRYFFRIGTSYYNSSEFERIKRNLKESFVPISRFGIGILSVFMIGDRLEVQTRNGFSPRGDTAFRTVRVEGRFGLAFVTEDLTGPQGTTIRVRLSQRNTSAARLFLSQASSYLREVVRRPSVPVLVDLPPARNTLGPATYLCLRDDAVPRLTQSNMVPVVLDVARWSERLSGRIILFFIRNEEGGLSHRTGANAIKVEEVKKYLKNYEHGNKLTVNGITMALKSVGRVLGTKDQRITGAIDVEIRGDTDLKYDVARNRLVGSGILIVRYELRQAIVSGLRELGIAEKMDEPARIALNTLEALNDENALSPERSTSNGLWSVKPVDDENILQAVLGEIPSGKWPPGLHRVIAKRLDISNTLSYRAISTLLATRRLFKKERSVQDTA